VTNPSSVFLNSYFWLIRPFDSDTDSDSDSEPTGTVLLKVTVLLAERAPQLSLETRDAFVVRASRPHGVDFLTKPPGLGAATARVADDPRQR
jgi:hypothetical protein